MPFNQHIADLAHILKILGNRNVVICPGSRNAPLIQAFHRDDHFICHSIVDERSAGYVAMGMAREVGDPVVVVTTSGSAALNLAPAVTEAFFQQIPLIVLTADRPSEWPPQFNNQIVNQEEIFIQNSKGFYNLPLEIADKDILRSVLNDIYRVIESAVSGRRGPVHLNIPLKEPLYKDLPEVITMNVYPEPVDKLTQSGEHELISLHERNISEYLSQKKKILIIAGKQTYTSEELSVLNSMVDTFNVVLIAENITNLVSGKFISCPDVLLASLNKKAFQQLTPDMVIIFGGQVVSKRTRIFIQNLRNTPVNVLDKLPLKFFLELTRSKSEIQENKYLSSWKKYESISMKRAGKFIKKAEWCNLSSVGKILDSIPQKAVVHLGNSGSIRYSQFFPTRADLKFCGNRGTSGIDGSVSTAVGAAMVSDELHVLILGDLSFVYDSNGLWNRNFPDNLKIIVLNDGGGGIFRIIDGPDKMPFFEEFSVTHHPVSIQLLAEAFGINYRRAKDFSQLKTGLETLFDKESGSILLELETSKSENSRIFKQFIKSIQEQ